MTGVAVLIVLAVAAAITWLGRVIAGAHRETTDLLRPVSRRALEHLRQDCRERNGTRW